MIRANPILVLRLSLSCARSEAKMKCKRRRFLRTRSGSAIKDTIQITHEQAALHFEWDSKHIWEAQRALTFRR